MTPFPYAFRIMAALHGHAPVELYRSRSRHYVQADWNLWAVPMSPEWECWVERPVPDRATITQRPHLWRRAGHADRLPLTREEKAALRTEPEYAFND